MPKQHASQACALRGVLSVPRGYYLTSFEYTLSYGVLKPVGGRSHVSSQYHLHALHASGEIDIAGPQAVDVEDGFDVATRQNDLTASKHHFCSQREGTNVRFANLLEIAARAPGDAEVIAEIDGVDLKADMAPCLKVCPSGYAGTPPNCVDIDECKAGTAACSPNATCTNTPGSYHCACKRHYRGDGHTCKRR
jgi:hypothetical protein